MILSHDTHWARNDVATKSKLGQEVSKELLQKKAHVAGVWLSIFIEVSELHGSKGGPSSSYWLPENLISPASSALLFTLSPLERHFDHLTPVSSKFDSIIDLAMRHLILSDLDSRLENVDQHGDASMLSRYTRPRLYMPSGTYSPFFKSL